MPTMSHDRVEHCSRVDMDEGGGGERKRKCREIAWGAE